MHKRHLTMLSITVYFFLYYCYIPSLTGIQPESRNTCLWEVSRCRDVKKSVNESIVTITFYSLIEKVKRNNKMKSLCFWFKFQKEVYFTVRSFYFKFVCLHVCVRVSFCCTECTRDLDWTLVKKWDDCFIYRVTFDNF